MADNTDPKLTEANIPKRAANMRIRLIGITGIVYQLLVGMDDFSDNMERPTLVEHKTQGRLYAATPGDYPVRTGSFSCPLFTRNNNNAVALLDVLEGRQLWANESTGRASSGQPNNPYIDDHVVTMEVEVDGADQDGGVMKTTYEKVRFVPTQAGSVDVITMSFAWTCYGAITVAAMRAS